MSSRKADDVLAIAAALGERLVDRGYVRERTDFGDRYIQPSLGDQVEDPAQARRGTVRRRGAAYESGLT